MANPDRLIEDLLDNLFTSGVHNEMADRLVLTTNAGKDLGGWGRAVIKQKLLAFVDALNMEEEDEKENQ